MYKLNFQKFEEICNLSLEGFYFKFNDISTRKEIENNFISQLKEFDIELIECDEFNNTKDIIDSNSLLVEVFAKDIYNKIVCYNCIIEPNMKIRLTKDYINGDKI